MAQQEASEEAEFLHNFKTVDERLEAAFLDSLPKADSILESQMEPFSSDLAEDDSMNRWLISQFKTFPPVKNLNLTSSEPPEPG